jgi:Zn-dependent protease with chaperone function
MTPALTASFFDGRTAERRAVRADLQPSSLSVLAPDDTRLAEWPYSEMAVVSRAGETVRYRCGGAEGRLETTDGALVAALARRIARRPTKILRATLAIGAGVVLGLAAVFLLIDRAPRLIAPVMPDVARNWLGRQVESSLLAGRRVCIDLKGTEALRSVLDRVAHGTALDDELSIKAVALPELNAVALPGGRIVVTDALIQRASSPEALAGVLAHEVGHLLERHPEQGLLRALGLVGVVQFATGGSDLASATSLLAGLVYSRQAEREADGHAIRLLAAAGVPTDDLADLLEGLARIDGPEPPGFISTHPATQERLQQLRHNPVAVGSPVLDAEAWQALRSICRQHRLARSEEEQ